MDSALPPQGLRIDTQLKHQDLPATRLRRKGRKIGKKKGQIEPQTKGKSKTKQTKSHKETYTHTLIKRKQRNKQK